MNMYNPRQAGTTPEHSGSAHLWQSALGEAITHNDDQRMWEIVSGHADQDEAHEAMATLISRLAYRLGRKVRFNEMFLMPIIQMAGSDVISNESLWKQSSYAISESLDIWLGRDTYKTIFNGIRPFDWVGTWRPHIIRTHLMRTVPGSQIEKVASITENIDCPDDAPRLGFLCMVLTSERGWPGLPQTNSQRDERLKTVVSHVLSTGPDSAPIVLAPDRVQFAVTDGVNLWLMSLHEAVGISGWSATPIAQTPDVIKITLRLESEQVRWTQFTVRKHQIGLQGVNEILALLAGIAPFVDTPNDMAASGEKMRAAWT
jgi:hypothetical protein